MYCFLFLTCLFSYAASGLADDDSLQSVLKELDVLRSSLRDFSELRNELETLKGRTNGLEDEVKILQQENLALHLKVGHLEKQMVEVQQYEKNNIQGLGQNFMSNKSANNSNGIGTTSKRKGAQIGKQKRLVPVETRVAFTAVVSVPDLVGLGIHQTIIFDTTLSNVGNAYHPPTGIFHAPVSGVYVFSVTLMVTRGHSQYLELVVDGGFIADIYCGTGDVRQTFSSMRHLVVEVKKDSDVWVRTGNSGQVRGYKHTDFSGFLLYQNA